MYSYNFKDAASVDKSFQDNIEPGGTYVFYSINIRDIDSHPFNGQYPPEGIPPVPTPVVIPLEGKQLFHDTMEDDGAVCKLQTLLYASF